VRKADNLWPGFATFPRLLSGFYRAARRKNNRETVARFHAGLEKKIFEIRDELESGAYRWGEYYSFWVIDPKLRRIESAPFRDRIVHQAMNEVMLPLFEPSFYQHSYACLPGRGTHRAVCRLHRWVRGHPEHHFLQMDVSKYFPSVDRDTLYSLLEARIADPRFLSLLRSLIFGAPGETGIPIGNLTSQLFANVYLNELDQFIKRHLRVRHYMRYMDDLVLLTPTREKAAELRRHVEHFARMRLQLIFNPHKVEIRRVRDGIGFIGHRIAPGGIYMRGRCLRRFRQRLREPLSLDQTVKRLLSYEAHVFLAKDKARIARDFQNLVFQRFQREGIMLS
jgi:retron-type reverse transcriptase